MATFDELFKAAGGTDLTTPAPAATDPDAISASTFQDTEAQTKLEEPKKGMIGGFVEGLWGVAKAAVDWVGDKKDHWIDNEDEDLGVTDWAKWKTIDDDIKTGKYTDVQVQEKIQQARKENVISDEYFNKQRQDANSVAAKATSEQELERKIKKDLYGQLAEFYAAEAGDQATVRILNQAIETQTETYMDYYRRISSSDEEFDKEKYYSELSSFMNKGRGFIRDYAESVMATKDNNKAYGTAEEKNKEFIKEMDNWNTRLTTQSKIASLKGSAGGLIDGEWDGIGGELGNLWGVGTGVLGTVTNLISLTAHGAKKLFGVYNSGYEELGIDYIAKPTDSWGTTAVQTLKQGFMELVDGSDTFLEAVIPIVPVTKLGLLGKVENAARLTKSLSTGAKAASYGKTFGVQMFQDAVYFDNAFQAFSQRGTNAQDREFNVLTNIAFNGVFSLLLSKPILKGSEEFRMFVSSTGHDASLFTNTPEVINALNKGDTKTAEAAIRLNIAKAQTGEELTAMPAGLTLTPNAKRYYQSAVNKVSTEMRAISDDITTDEGFKAQKNFSVAFQDRSSPTIYAKSEAKRTTQEKVMDDAMYSLLSDKALSGKYTFTAMLNTPDSQAVIRQAVDKAMRDSAVAAGTPLQLTKSSADKLYNTLIALKNGIDVTPLTKQESPHMVQIIQNLNDIIRDLPDASKLFAPDTIPAAKITTQKAIVQKVAPSYEEMAARIKKLKEPKSYTDFLSSRIDEAFMDVHMLDTLLPQNSNEAVTSLATKIMKNFGDEASGTVDLKKIKDSVDTFAGKKYISDEDYQALSFYHLGKTQEDFELLKQATFSKDVSDRTLFTSHPFFKLFTRDVENKRWIPSAVLRDARNIEDAMGKLFLKAPVKQVEELPLFKYVLTDDAFKADLLSSFKEIVTHSSENTGENIWSLVRYMFMEPKTMSELQKQFIQDKEVGKMLLANYVEHVVQKDPVLEGAFYKSWLSKLPQKPFYINQPYAEYAKNFEAYLENSVLPKLPDWMDKKKFKSIMYANGLDEVIKLNQIDYELGLQINGRFTVSKEIAQLESLKLQMLDETLEPATRVTIQDKINRLTSIVNTQFRYGAKADSLEKTREALLALKKNPEFTKTYTELSSDLAQSIQAVVDSTSAVSFERARKNLVTAISKTPLRAEEYTTVQQFLLIPRSLIEKSRQEYLTTLATGKPIEMQLYLKGVVVANIYRGTKNMEEVYAKTKEIIAKYKQLPTTKAERIIALKDKSVDPFKKIPHNDIITRNGNLADVKGKKGIIIVGRGEFDPLDMGQKISGVKSSANFKFKTFNELLKELNPTLRSGFDMKNPASAQKFYKQFVDQNPNIYITQNALDSYMKSFKSDPKYVELDTRALDIIKANITPLLEKPGETITVLPLSLSLQDATKTVDLFINTAKDSDQLFSLRDNGIFFKETIEKLIDPALKQEIFARGTLESFLEVGATGSKTANIFDQLFKDSDLEVFWSGIRNDIQKVDHIDILKYAKGRDFTAKYDEHIQIFKQIVEDKFPGSADYPWFTDAFQMSPEEFLSFSRAHLLANDTGKTTVSFKHMFGRAVQANVLNKLADLKSPKNVGARRFITFNILNTLMDAGYTIPKMSLQDLARLVDGMEVPTVAIIGDAGRYLMNPTRLKEAVNKNEMQEWVSKIEQSLKFDTSLQARLNNFGLSGTMDISKVVDEGEVDVAMEGVARELNKDEKLIMDAYMAADEAGKADFRNIYPEIFQKTETDADILDTNLGYSSSGDFSALPRKLEDADTIDLFEGMGARLQNVFDGITSTLYLKRFSPYMNLERGKTIDMEANADILGAYEKIFDPKASEYFADTNKYVADPLKIDEDFATTDFFVSLGKENIKITSRQQAKEIILEQWSAMNKLTDKERKNKLMFNFYAVPKGSAIKYGDDGYFSLPGRKFIDLSELPHHESFFEGGKRFQESPLLKWAFSDEILKGNTTFLGLVEETAFKTKGDKARRMLEIFEEVKKANGIDTNMFDDLASGISIKDEITDIPKIEIYENGDLVEEIADEIIDETLLRYNPVLSISHSDGSVELITDKNIVFTPNTDIDLFLRNYSKDGQKVTDVTTAEDILDSGVWKIDTQYGRTYHYTAKGELVPKSKMSDIRTFNVGEEGIDNTKRSPGFVLPEGAFEKDAKKAAIATDMIGYYSTGGRLSSTQKYLEAAYSQGVPVNASDNYGPETIAFVSVQGNKQASDLMIDKTVAEARKVLNAGGAVVMDNSYNRSTDWNITGEALVFKRLTEDLTVTNISSDKDFAKLVANDINDEWSTFSKTIEEDFDFTSGLIC